MEVDLKLISACKDENRSAQYQLYTACYSHLLGICLRYMSSKDEAREILNQGFFKILKNIDKYNDSQSFKAWISKIMINTIIDGFRKKKRHFQFLENFDLLVEHEPISTAVYNQADLMYEAEDLELMLHKLPKMSRTVFSLFAIDDYKHKEISEMLGITVNTSKWHVASARKKLQTLVLKSVNRANSMNYGKSAG